MHTLDEAGLLDGFSPFCRSWGDGGVAGFRIDGVQRIFLPTIYFVLQWYAGVVWIGRVMPCRLLFSTAGG